MSKVVRHCSVVGCNNPHPASFFNPEYEVYYCEVCASELDRPEDGVSNYSKRRVDGFKKKLN